MNKIKDKIKSFSTCLWLANYDLSDEFWTRETRFTKMIKLVLGLVFIEVFILGIVASAGILGCSIMGWPVGVELFSVKLLKFATTLGHYCTFAGLPLLWCGVVFKKAIAKGRYFENLGIQEKERHFKKLEIRKALLQGRYFENLEIQSELAANKAPMIPSINSLDAPSQLDELINSAQFQLDTSIGLTQQMIVNYFGKGVNMGTPGLTALPEANDEGKNNYLFDGNPRGEVPMLDGRPTTNLTALPEANDEGKNNYSFNGNPRGEVSMLDGRPATKCLK